MKNTSTINSTKRSYGYAAASALLLSAALTVPAFAEINLGSETHANVELNSNNIRTDSKTNLRVHSSEKDDNDREGNDSSMHNSSTTESKHHNKDSKDNEDSAKNKEDKSNNGKLLGQFFGLRAWINQFFNIENTATTTNATIITNVTATSTNKNNALITWNSSILSLGRVYYSTSSPVTIASTTPFVNATGFTSSKATLKNLTASTTYYFKVFVKDFFGNTNISTESSFRTQ